MSFEEVLRCVTCFRMSDKRVCCGCVTESYTFCVICGTSDYLHVSFLCNRDGKKCVNCKVFPVGLFDKCANCENISLGPWNKCINCKSNVCYNKHICSKCEYYLY